MCVRARMRLYFYFAFFIHSSFCIYPRTLFLSAFAIARKCLPLHPYLIFPLPPPPIYFYLLLSLSASFIRLFHIFPSLFASPIVRVYSHYTTHEDIYKKHPAFAIFESSRSVYIPHCPFIRQSSLSPSLFSYIYIYIYLYTHASEIHRKPDKQLFTAGE